MDGAAAEFRKAIDLESKDPLSHFGLGVTLSKQGRFGEARTALRRSLKLFPEGDRLRPFAVQEQANCERLAALDEKLPAVFSGRAEPADAAERLALAQLCQLYKHRHAAAAHFYADAFADEPKLAADLQQQSRYNAACSAALAAAGQGEDAKALSDKVQRMLRHQALGWLCADLAAYAKLAERPEPAAKQVVRQRLGHWQEDTDLAAFRDKPALAMLPADERQAWTALWADVDALLRKMAEKSK